MSVYDLIYAFSNYRRGQKIEEQEDAIQTIQEKSTEDNQVK